jgi:hypothetical protein
MEEILLLDQLRSSISFRFADAQSAEGATENSRARSEASAG